MDKQAFAITKGFNPTKLDGTKFVDGESVEVDAYTEDLVKSGILIPIVDEGGDFTPTKEEYDATRAEWVKEYQAQTVPELKALAEAARFEIPEGIKKAELVELLADHEMGEEGDE